MKYFITYVYERGDRWGYGLATVIAKNGFMTKEIIESFMRWAK